MILTNGCSGAGTGVQDCITKQSTFFWNFPTINPDNVEIFNPKIIVGESLTKAQDMLRRSKNMAMWAQWDTDLAISDVVDATSVPASSSEEAIASMETIVEQANDIIKREREEMILNFVSAILFFVPVGGAAASAAGLTALRSALRLIGTAGEAGLAVYGIVQDPKSAVIAILGFLLNAGGGRGSFKSAAGSRRGMSQNEYNGLGGVKVSLDRSGLLRGGVCRF
ncbi:hypothetical protein BDZ85DRAFT_109795 [Elsinoe ampelina]|uniref:Uncharacterized protein n=1 Tax=Elsinoe ampelina TaxID=302913 RepID=A0A6A6GCM4_9PEZI|nr:hypothetical protein BDZ85DRAFT_109795 [Elsinoe ampelina]